MLQWTLQWINQSHFEIELHKIILYSDTRWKPQSNQTFIIESSQFQIDKPHPVSFCFYFSLPCNGLVTVKTPTIKNHLTFNGAPAIVPALKSLFLFFLFDPPRSPSWRFCQDSLKFAKKPFLLAADCILMSAELLWQSVTFHCLNVQRSQRWNKCVYLWNTS